MKGTKQRVVVFGAFLLASLILSQTAYADIWIKQKQHTDGYTVMGQNVPAQDTVSKTWITKDWMRVDNSDKSSIIVRLDKGVIYLIDHFSKTYSEMPLNIDKAMDDSMNEAMKGMSEEQKKYMSSMIQGMMKVAIKVTPTNEKKKIGKWNCLKYLQRIETAMGPMDSEIWATGDIKIDYDLVSRYNAIMMTNQPGMRESLNQFQKEMEKIQGVPVLTTSSSTVMGVKVNTALEMTDFIEAKAPAGVNKVPADYAKQ